MFPTSAPPIDTPTHPPYLAALMTGHPENMQVVELTPAAADRLKAMQAESDAAHGQSLRVWVEHGGCSGSQYGMEFTRPHDGDIAIDAHGVQVLVEPASAPFLQGSVIDYEDSLAESGFKIRNPNARQSCGCGRSFEA